MPRGRNAANDAKRLKAKDWRARAIRLRTQGFSLRAIAAKVGMSVRAVDKALQEGLDAVPVEDVERVRKLELSRVDRMLLGVWKKARTGDTDAISAVSRLMERRAKYLGLDKATKIRVEVDDALEKFLIKLKGELPADVFERVLLLATDAGDHGAAAGDAAAGEDASGDGQEVLP